MKFIVQRMVPCFRSVVFLSLLCAQLTGFTAAQAGVDHHATPSKTRQGNGTQDKPWDLVSALGRSSIRPGGTLWLSGGTYQGSFVSFLEGTETSPITIRPMPGQRVVFDANGLSSALTIRGQWTIWQGIEVTNS